MEGAAAPTEPTTIYLVDKPEAAQSVIMIGAPGVDRRSPDYGAITLMNTILGGSFSSRLNQILREQKGFTYGAGSDYDWRPVAGPFIASSAVRTNVTDSSLAIFFSEFKRLRSEPVTDAELARARSYVVLGTLGDFETTRQVAGGLGSLDVFGLPLSTIPKDLERIQALGAADVQRAAEKYLVAVRTAAGSCRVKKVLADPPQITVEVEREQSAGAASDVDRRL